MSKKLLIKLFALVAAMMCSLGMQAAEAYACYTPSNTTLTFYYDNYRSSRTGTTYSLNTGSNNPGWWADGNFINVTRVVFDSSFANARPTTTYKWFNCMFNLRSITDINGYLNTSAVTNMNNMFGGCHKLESPDLGGFNTANVTNMAYMFDCCYSLKSPDLSSFNTAKVTDMTNMFASCSSLTSLDLSGFNTAKVTDMTNMFVGCSILNTIYVRNGWSTAAVTSSSDMFKDCTLLVGGQGTAYDENHVDKAYAHIDGGTTNPGYLTSNPEAYACYTSSNTTLTFYYDIYRSTRSGTIYDLNTGSNNPGWYTDGTYANVTKVVFNFSFFDASPTTTYCWFYNMKKLTDITGMMDYLNTSAVTNMYGMFLNCKLLTSLDVSGFNTTRVTNMSFMFAGCSGLTSLNLSRFNTAKVTNMGYMFYGCSGLTSLGLTSFNTAKVTSMTYMFSNCSALKTICVGSGWSTAAVTSSGNMFLGCTSLVGSMGTTYSSSHVDKAYAHIDGGTSNPGYLSNKEAYACYTSSSTMLTFYYDNQRSNRTGTTYDLNAGSNYPGWYTDGTYANVTKVVFNFSFFDASPTTTYCWFYNMKKLTDITGMMDYLNTSAVTNMYGMFLNCKLLTSLDVSGFYTISVTNMSFMFAGCSGLTSLDLSRFNTAKVTNMGYMFYGCSGLTSLDLSSFNTAKVTDMYQMFSNCSNLRSIYVGSGWSTAAVTSSGNMFLGCTSLVGGQGTTYDANHVDKAYAHIDGGTSNPGYFTAAGATFLRGDVNGDNLVNITDAIKLINYLANGNAEGINLEAANCNGDSTVNITDAIILINFLQNGSW